MLRLERLAVEFVADLEATGEIGDPRGNVGRRNDRQEEPIGGVLPVIGARDTLVEPLRATGPQNRGTAKVREAG
jgi:hypothetical protein